MFINCARHWTKHSVLFNSPLIPLLLPHRSVFTKFDQKERIWMLPIVHYNGIWRLVQVQLRMPNRGMSIIRWGQWQWFPGRWVWVAWGGTWFWLQAEKGTDEPQPWKRATCERGTRSRLPVLEKRNPVGVLRDEGVEVMGGSQIPHPRNSQTLIALVYILEKLESGAK